MGNAQRPCFQVKVIARLGVLLEVENAAAAMASVAVVGGSIAAAALAEALAEAADKKNGRGGR